MPLKVDKLRDTDSAHSNSDSPRGSNGGPPRDEYDVEHPHDDLNGFIYDDESTSEDEREDYVGFGRKKKEKHRRSAVGGGRASACAPKNAAASAASAEASSTGAAAKLAALRQKQQVAHEVSGQQKESTLLAPTDTRGNMFMGGPVASNSPALQRLAQGSSGPLPTAGSYSSPKQSQNGAPLAAPRPSSQGLGPQPSMRPRIRPVNGGDHLSDDDDLPQNAEPPTPTPGAAGMMPPMPNGMVMMPNGMVMSNGMVMPTAVMMPNGMVVPMATGMMMPNGMMMPMGQMMSGDNMYQPAAYASAGNVMVVAEPSRSGRPMPPPDRPFSGGRRPSGALSGMGPGQPRSSVAGGPPANGVGGLSPDLQPTTLQAPAPWLQKRKDDDFDVDEALSMFEPSEANSQPPARKVLSEFTASRPRDIDLEVSSRAQSVPTTVASAAERLKKAATVNSGAASMSGSTSDSALLLGSLPNNGSCSSPGNIGAPSRFARLGEANLKAPNAWQSPTGTAPGASSSKPSGGLRPTLTANSSLGSSPAHSSQPSPMRGACGARPSDAADNGIPPNLLSKRLQAASNSSAAGTHSSAPGDMLQLPHLKQTATQRFSESGGILARVSGSGGSSSNTSPQQAADQQRMPFGHGGPRGSMPTLPSTHSGASAPSEPAKISPRMSWNGGPQAAGGNSSVANQSAVARSRFAPSV